MKQWVEIRPMIGKCRCVFEKMVFSDWPQQKRFKNFSIHQLSQIAAQVRTRVGPELDMPRECHQGLKWKIATQQQHGNRSHRWEKSILGVELKNNPRILLLTHPGPNRAFDYWWSRIVFFILLLSTNPALFPDQCLSGTMKKPLPGLR